MRRFLTLLFVVVFMGIAFAVPTCHAVTIEPHNSFCVYGVTGMTFTLEVGSSSIDYTFGSGSTHFDNPYVISDTQIMDWYSEGVDAIHFIVGNCSAVTLSSPYSLPAAGSPDAANIEFFISANSPLELSTTLMNLRRAYLFPIGTFPEVSGVQPTPFVNDGDDVVVDDTDIKSTIVAVDDFQPFIQFIFSTVIPWAAVAGVVILVLATVKFMLKG